MQESSLLANNAFGDFNSFLGDDFSERILEEENAYTSKRSEC